MTNPSQHITLKIKVNRKLAERAAVATGFAAVVLPFMLLAKGISGPDAEQIPLYLDVTPIQSTYVPVDERELDCLAANIYYESRNQPMIGQLAVGLTTLVRLQRANWPDSICKVVKQPKQFSWVGNEYKQRGRPTNSDMAYLHAQNLASRILSGDYNNVLDVFYPSHYHTVAVNPSWNRNMAKLARINDHIFYE